jgi:cytochrome c-type biogenesis protein
VSVQSAQPSRGSSWLQYAGLVTAFVAIVVGGFLVFRAFATTPDLGVFNLYALAIVAGVASFFSPCAFPLLPGYFSAYYLAGNEEHAGRPAARRGLGLGLAAALGVISFSLILGLIIAALGTGVGQSLSISGAEPSQLVRVFRGLVGVILLTLGIGQLSGWNLKPRFVDAFTYRTRPQRDGARRPARSLYLYGLGYSAAGIGCTGPILAGLVVFALASGGFNSALTAFGVFALTMGTLMLVLSGLVAASRQTLVTRLKAATPKIKSVASVLLILVGVFNIYTAFNLGLFQRILFP